jgi:uncharacterized protein YbaR (Trm112 family)
MQEETLDGHLARPVAIDLCFACQSFWFDSHESLGLTPASTLKLFRVIGEHAARPRPAGPDLAKCPRCKGRLRRTHDMQRATRFEYLRCPNGHGRLTTFFDFLREKDFIRPLTAKQIAELRASVQSINCSNCGAAVDLAAGAACAHCRSPLSMLDMKQAGALVAQLRHADRPNAPVDPALPLELERARREVETAFRGLPADASWVQDVSSFGLVGAGLSAVARWLKGLG